MKQFSFGVGLVLLVFLTWRMVTSLSSDALGMALGVVFGLLAAVPSVLLVLASQRRQARRESGYYDDDGDDEQRTVTNFFLITNNTTNTDNRSVTIHTPAPQGMPLIADRQREIQSGQGGRVFRVVGEREEL